jgi:hypothetical protein
MQPVLVYVGAHLVDGLDIRPEGDRLVNGDARCAKGYQGSLSCHTGDHVREHFGETGISP